MYHKVAIRIQFKFNTCVSYTLLKIGINKYQTIQFCIRSFCNAPSLGVSLSAWLGHPCFSTLHLWLVNSIDDPFDQWSTIIRPFDLELWSLSHLRIGFPGRFWRDMAICPLPRSRYAWPSTFLPTRYLDICDPLWLPICIYKLSNLACVGYAQADQVYAKILGPSKHALKLVLVLNTLNKGIGKTSENDVWNMLLVELAAVTWNLAAAQKWHSCKHDCMIANIQEREWCMKHVTPQPGSC